MLSLTEWRASDGSQSRSEGNMPEQRATVLPQLVSRPVYHAQGPPNLGLRTRGRWALDEEF